MGQIPTTLNHVMNYVQRHGSCIPEHAELVDNDEACPVWKVTVSSFDDSWVVPPPKFWYVCPVPVMNFYRNDHQRPSPWLPLEKQNEDKVIDYIKSFHIGLTRRLVGRSAD